MKKDALISVMHDNAGRITTKRALDAGFSSSMLQMLVSQGLVVQESRGVFAIADIPVDDFAVLSLRWPKAVFSHTSSLYLNGLIDLVPSFMEISLPQGYKEFSILNEFPRCIVHHENARVFDLGITIGASPTGTAIKLHDCERSICDLLVARKHGEADPHLMKQAMKEYFARPGKDLAKLVRFAKATKVEKELYTYLEVFT